MAHAAAHAERRQRPTTQQARWTSGFIPRTPRSGPSRGSQEICLKDTYGNMPETYARKGWYSYRERVSSRQPQTPLSVDLPVLYGDSGTGMDDLILARAQRAMGVLAALSLSRPDRGGAWLQSWAERESVSREEAESLLCRRDLVGVARLRGSAVVLRGRNSGCEPKQLWDNV